MHSSFMSSPHCGLFSLSQTVAAYRVQVFQQSEFSHYQSSHEAEGRHMNDTNYDLMRLLIKVFQPHTAAFAHGDGSEI